MARKRMDASLLLLPMVGFLPATDKRIRKTVREIEKRLLFKGLVLRYETETGVDGLPPGEGAFLACSFWLADNYLLQGRVAEARRLFNRLKKLSNDVGLFAEEYDPVGKTHAGKFPPGFFPCRADQHGAGSDDAGTKTCQKNPQTPIVRPKSAIKRILAIDIGGTGLKAAVIGPDGKIPRANGCG